MRSLRGGAGGLRRLLRWRRPSLALLGGLLIGWLLSALLANLPAARALPPPPPLAPAPPQAREIRGVWLTSNDMGTLRDRARLGEAVNQLARLHFNSLYPVVWNGGYAYYPSAVTERRNIQSFTFRGLQGQDILADLIPQAHRQGLRVIPWFEFGFMAPPTSELARLHPGWLSRKRDGGTTSISAAGEVVWLNPFLPEVQAFITELVLEVVTSYDADGIQFDDHMSLPSEFGYDSYTVAQYRKDTKKDPPADRCRSGLGEVAGRPDHRVHGAAAADDPQSPAPGHRVGVTQLLQLRLQAAAAGLAGLGAPRDRR